MAQTATLHIKVEPLVARRLKLVAGKRRVTVGELVRRAVETCYQTEWLSLNAHKRQALDAYRGGFISLGKLAEVMGQTPLELREWLHEQGIALNGVVAPDDHAHA